MPSHLRIQSNFNDYDDASFESHPTSPSSPPYKKQKMTVTQTYRLAHTARGKLSAEASRGEYDLRVLVGHANLLDNLMIELAEAEKEQDTYYHSNIKFTHQHEPKETVVEIPDGSDSEEDNEDVDADEATSDYSDDDQEEEEQLARMAVPLKRSASKANLVALAEDLAAGGQHFSTYEELYDDEEFDNPELSLVRTHSHSEPSQQQPSCPDLVHDSDESDDDAQSPPPSPPGHAALDFTKIVIKDFASKQRDIAAEALHEEGFWIPERQTLVAAC